MIFDYYAPYYNADEICNKFYGTYHPNDLRFKNGLGTGCSNENELIITVEIEKEYTLCSYRFLESQFYVSISFSTS